MKQLSSDSDSRVRKDAAAGSIRDPELLLLVLRVFERLEKIKDRYSLNPGLVHLAELNHRPNPLRRRIDLGRNQRLL